MPTITKRGVIIGTVAVTLLALMRMRRNKRNRKNAAAASLSERYAFPVVFKTETNAALDLTLSDPTAYPPRLTAATVLGLPQDATDPLETACVVVDAVTTIAAAAVGSGNDAAAESVEAKLFTALANGDDAALVEAIKAYTTASSPFMQGLTDAERSAVKCIRIADTPASLSLAVVPPTLAPNATKKQRAEAEAKAQQAPIDLTFGFLVTSKDVAVYVCPVAEAKTIISLIVVSKENINTDVAKTDQVMMHTALEKGLAVSRPAITRLVEEAAAEAATKVTSIAAKDEAAANVSANTTTVIPHATHAITVLENSKMKIRAVLPTAETTVETIRVPIIAGTEEVFITIKGGDANTTSNNNSTSVTIPPSNYARITYHPTMPATWEDEKAITDPSEKEDEYKRNLMAHFLGYISNSVTLHPIDISGRKCLWFGETNEGTCCRTYVCPNFDITGKQSSKKKNNSNEAKGMTVIRWEGPADQWEKSLTVLNAFLDYFQFQ